LTVLAAAGLLACLTTLPRTTLGGPPHRGPVGCADCPSGRCGPGMHGHCGHGHCAPCGHCGHGHCHHGSCGHCLHHDVIEKRYFLRSQGKSWHSPWYDPAEGRPIALVVPPTAEFQTQYSWGVPSSRVVPIYHQFRRPYPGAGCDRWRCGGRWHGAHAHADVAQRHGAVRRERGPWTVGRVL